MLIFVLERMYRSWMIEYNIRDQSK